MTSDLVFFVSAAYVLGMFVGVFAGVSANIVTKITGSGVVRPINADRDLVVLSSPSDTEQSIVSSLKPRIEPVVAEEATPEEAPEEIPNVASLPNVAPEPVAPAEPIVAAEQQVEEATEVEEPIAAYDANNVQALRRMIQKKREMAAAEAGQKQSRAA